MAFYGITSGTINLATNEFKSSEEGRLSLVFERASEGNLMDYVQERFIDATREESWSIVVDAIRTIAVELDDLHRRQVAHG